MVTVAATVASTWALDLVAAVAGVARRVNERSRSFGVALSSCIPPASGQPIFDLPAGVDIEIKL